MKKLVMTFALVVAVCLAGCMPTLSVHPIYTNETTIFDPAILGVWTDPDSGEIWEFTQSGEMAYLLVHTDEGGVGYLDAHLVQIDDAMFLDLSPGIWPEDAPDLEISDFVVWHYLRVHMFLLVDFTDSTLTLTALDEDEWLQGYLEENPDAIAHEAVIQDPEHDTVRVFLTASTEELQAFLAEHADNEEAFDVGITLIPMAEEEAQPEEVPEPGTE